MNQLRATFLTLKPQLKYTSEELAKIQQIPPGVTSEYQWWQYSESWPEVVDIPKEILR